MFWSHNQYANIPVNITKAEDEYYNTKPSKSTIKECWEKMRERFHGDPDNVFFIHRGRYTWGVTVLTGQKPVIVVGIAKKHSKQQWRSGLLAQAVALGSINSYLHEHGPAEPLRRPTKNEAEAVLSSWPVKFLAGHQNQLPKNKMKRWCLVNPETLSIPTVKKSYGTSQELNPSTTSHKNSDRNNPSIPQDSSSNSLKDFLAKAFKLPK